MNIRLRGRPPRHLQKGAQLLLYPAQKKQIIET